MQDLGERTVEFEAIVGPEGQVPLPPDVARELPAGEPLRFKAAYAPEDAVYEQLIDAQFGEMILLGMDFQVVTLQFRYNRGMKIALALFALMLPVFAAEPASKAEKEVLATVDAWREAMVKGDATALGKLYHADLAYEHSSAKNETKSEAIESATKAGALTKSIELHSTVVHVYGNTATVKSLGDFTNATGTVSHLDTLMVFVKSPQGWQMVARESTKLP